MTGSGTRLGLRCQYCAGFAGCCLSAGGAVALARVLDEDELIEHWTHRSMRNRSRLQPRAMSGWRASNPRPLRLEGGRASPVVRRRAPCPALWPLGARLFRRVRRSLRVGLSVPAETRDLV